MRTLLAWLLLTALFTFGCATKAKLDWPSRVGIYTYDEAVTEMGPPDKTETLTDGTRIADWLQARSGGFSLSLGLASFGSNTAVGTGTTVGNVGGRPVLRLTFGSDGKLQSAQRLGR
jgi:hypothetical protein